MQRSHFYILLTIIIGSCTQGTKPVPANIQQTRAGIETGDSIKITYTVGGKTKALLQAPTLNRVEDTVTYVEFPKQVHVDFFNTQTQQKDSYLDAHYAKYKELESKVFLKDSVKFVGLINGDTLYTSKMYWDRNRQPYQLYTDEEVLILTKTEIIKCRGFEVSQDFKNKLFKNVTNSQFRVPNRQY
jgi:hypothetical protein